MIVCNPSRISSLLALLFLSLPQAIAQREDEPLFAISIRNAMLEKRFVQIRNEEEPVVTNILNSDVQGQQSTTTETRIRILPDSMRLRFDLISTGCVKSQTTGINRQALIDSTGQHQFEITKPFWFDGSRFLTQPGHGTIRASQSPQRVVSAVGANMPFLRPLSDRLAWEEVNRRQAEINLAVAKDVSRTVLPKINRIVDNEFAELGQQLTRIQSQVESSLSAMPLRWTTRSTDTLLSVAAVHQKSDLATTEFSVVPTNFPPLAADEEIALSFSDSIATVLLDQFVLAGQTLTDTQIESASKVWNQAGEDKWSLASLSQLYQEIQRNSSAEPNVFSIQLAKVQPLAVRFDRGFVCIDTSFQIVPTVGTPSGWIKITWRLRGKGISNDQWAVTLRQVDVNDVDDSIPIGHAKQSQLRVAQQDLRIPVESTFVPDDDSNVAIPMDPNIDRLEEDTVETGTVWMTIVRNATQSIQKRSPTVILPIEFDTPNAVAGSARLRMVRIESFNGVLRAAFQTIDRPVEPWVSIPFELQRDE
jgi:hypothetical protein